MLAAFGSFALVILACIAAPIRVDAARHVDSVSSLEGDLEHRAA